MSELLSPTYTGDAPINEFQAKRIPFIWLNDRVHCNLNRNDARTTLQWAKEDFNVTAGEFETLPRGCFFNGRIQLFQGTDYRAIDIARQEQKLRQTIAYYYKFFTDDYKLYNGVKVGEAGEEWEPMYEIDPYALYD